MAGEFDLIARYFSWPARSDSVSLSVGDDAALLDITPDHQLTISVDTLVPGVHYPLDTAPFDIGHKALSVNVSDIAAMGGEPRWFTLALTLPTYDTHWLEGFSAGLRAAADDYGVDLIGGDTTRGSHTISIQIMGETPVGKALRRSAGQMGDILYTTATTGDAAAGLAIYLERLPELSAQQQYCLDRLNRPTARILESRIIRDYANACIDISDGLLQDLSHILKASDCGATINTDQLTFSSALKQIYSREQCLNFALCGGDDYELLFSVPQAKHRAFQQAMQQSGYTCQAIGKLTANRGKLRDQHGNPLTATGFQHF